MEKAEEIQSYILTAVEYSFLYFHGCEVQLFKIYFLFNKYFPVFHYFVYDKFLFINPNHLLHDVIPRLPNLMDDIIDIHSVKCLELLAL